MAKEYIEREAAVVMADYAEDEHPYDKDPKRPETYSAYHEGWSDACDYIRSRLESLPAADVEPVRHGRWIRLQHSGTIVCGNCGRNIRKNRGNDYADFEPYCPNCGCRMDLES